MPAELVQEVGGCARKNGVGNEKEAVSGGTDQDGRHVLPYPDPRRDEQLEGSAEPEDLDLRRAKRSAPPFGKPAVGTATAGPRRRLRQGPSRPTTAHEGREGPRSVRELRAEVAGVFAL